ncbi:MAG: restriction endonuclease subunit S [Nitrospirae bacterium YQR-1]
MKTELTELNILFRVQHGNKFDYNKMELCNLKDGGILFIGRSGENNGIVGFVEKDDNIEPYDAGLITVALGGSTLSSFVQPYPFYTAQNIDVLVPIVEMSLDIKLYYCICIMQNRFRYSTFGREANRTLKNILVPKLESVPQWVNGITKIAAEELRQNLLEWSI